MNFEDELRAALARRDPPAGFAERVVRAARPAPRRRAFRAAAWAAAAGLVVGGGLEYQRYRAAERARQQTVLAIRIAAKQLLAAQKKLDRLAMRRVSPLENR